LQQQLADHIRESEEKSRTVYDPDANLFEAAIKRVRAADQMQVMVNDIRMAMTWNAPPALGALYSKVMEMREIVGAEQEAARLAQESKAERKRWQRQQREASQRLKLGVSVLTLILILYLWLLLFVLTNQRIT
jgi:ABC-type hemin transport system substrate-binding protein